MQKVSSSVVLHVDRLTKTFASALRGGVPFVAVNGISFDLYEGEILGLLGANGAGKTTTIQMLLSTLTPTSGVIEYFGKDFFAHRAEILKGISFASSYIKLPSKISVYDNLDIMARLLDVPASERHGRIEHYLNFFGMWKHKDKATGVLSAGQMTRVILCKAFLNNPKIVLLDEPTASLDPDIALEVRHFIQERQKQDRVSIIFTSHNMAEVEQVCNRLLIMQDGNIVAENTPEALAATISQCHLHLTVTTGKENLDTYLAAQGLAATYQDSVAEIIVDEKKVASTLIGLTHAGVVYSKISVTEPTLEDYFLNFSLQAAAQKKR